MQLPHRVLCLPHCLFGAKVTKKEREEYRKLERRLKRLQKKQQKLSEMVMKVVNGLQPQAYPGQCYHANEVPNQCECQPICYCKYNTCRRKQ